MKVSKPIPSATVLLLRDTAASVEVFMVTRNAGIDFAGGALVYPGGKTDPGDILKPATGLCDGVENLSPIEIGNRVCAIRETFEETGFLLAREKGLGEFVGGTRCSCIEEQYRNKIHDGTISMKQLAIKEKLSLACDSLVPFAHWITPRTSPKRYDTWFYLAEVPKGQTGTHDNLESVDSIWINPLKALDGAAEGRFNIVFATRMNLVKLARFNDVHSAIKAAQKDNIVTVEPTVTKDGDSLTFSIPLAAGYGIENETEVNGPTKLPIN